MKTLELKQIIKEVILEEITNKSNKVDILKGINSLLSVSSPQDNCFIGAFSLCTDFSDWKEEVLSDLNDDPNVLETLNHFEKNVKGEIINEDDVLTDKDYDNELTIDDKYEMQKAYPISKLKSTPITPPTGFTHFMILPVDYNHPGMSEIGIAYMTSEGKKYYSNHITGDY